MIDNDWEENALEYGFIVTRLPSGAWWHMHFGRSTLNYPCELLGRKSNILLSIQLLSPGCVTISPRFLLTLDAQGVEISPTELRIDFHWGKDPVSHELRADAQHFQQEIMPLIYDSDPMQSAVRHIVEKQAYLHRYAREEA